MKIGGKKYDGPSEKVIIIPRPDGDVIFKARAVIDYSEMEKLCPDPLPPVVTKVGGVPTPDFNDAEYKKKVVDHSSKRFEYMLMKSLEATPGLEWTTAKMEDPSTWKNIEDDLKGAGFTVYEVNRIFMGVNEINGLSDKMVKEAQERFFEGLKEEKK